MEKLEDSAPLLGERSWLLMGSLVYIYKQTPSDKTGGHQSQSHHKLTSPQVTRGTSPSKTHRISHRLLAVSVCFIQCVRLESQLQNKLEQWAHQYKGPFTAPILGNRSDEVLCGQERCWDVKCFGMKSFGQMPLSIWDRRKQSRTASFPLHCPPFHAHSHNHPCYFLL